MFVFGRLWELHGPILEPLGILGALCFAGAFRVLGGPMRGRDVALLAAAGFVGALAFTSDLHLAVRELPMLPGFIVWQTAVGTILVWMSHRQKEPQTSVTQVTESVAGRV